MRCRGGAQLVSARRFDRQTRNAATSSAALTGRRLGTFEDPLAPVFAGELC